eukprot:s274_g10.t1
MVSLESTEQHEVTGFVSADPPRPKIRVCPSPFVRRLVPFAGLERSPSDFNDHISFDGAEWTDPQGKSYGFYHFIDTATNFQVAVPFRQRTTEGLIEAFSSAWLRWAGPPKSMMFDSATEANSEIFAQFLQQHAIQSYVIPTDAHWQLGRAERHGAVLMHMLDKYHSEHPIQNFHDFEQGLIHLCGAKNAMSRHEGFTPELWVLGKMRALPGNNTDLYLDSASYLGLSEDAPEGRSFLMTLSSVLSSWKILNLHDRPKETFLASAAKRQKVEVKIRDLSPEDVKLFDKAKDKELDSWLATDTVRKILRNQVPEGQLLRSRWVLTWKNLDEVEQKELGTSRKAKARLVILGYEDPLIDVLPRDSPTLGRDTRMLALQCIASHRWSARSFDIRTAFLRGSRQDDRILGVEPPIELRAKMQLRSNEVCELLKGAYGLINAPLLWYVELKAALVALGFVISPMDPCLFVLPKTKTSPGDISQIHGILGIHVDDGIGGGDAIFTEAIRNLEKRFPFGSQRTGSFTFTGVQINQSHNGDITINQQDYINDIPPININRDRRKQPDLPVTKDELQSLRGLIGSLQYAATNTRPDLSCRLSLLQAKVTCATVADLMVGNRILNDAKKHSDTAIRIQALPIDQIRFLSFSDAAFATREKANSQKGCLILATTETIDQIQSSPVSPLIWFSKKINRVVSSTLASETFALSGALDLLSWTRIHWAWMLNPNLKWQSPEETLKDLPNAFAVVDCKSLYDLLQKTSIPQCTEYRTTLEALVVRERLKEGVIIKWVHSAAQMADALTKDMDTSVLRSFLSQGKCILHDVNEILKQRADKKIRQHWYQESSSSPDVSALHVFAMFLEICD